MLNAVIGNLCASEGAAVHLWAVRLKALKQQLWLQFEDAGQQRP